MRIEDGPHEFRHDVHRQGGAVLLAAVEPGAVVLAEELGEVGAEGVLQGPERVLQPRFVGPAELDLPLGELDDQFDPFPPRHSLAAAGVELPEAGGEVAGEPLLPDPVALEESGDHGEDLPRVDRLDEVVADLGADGVLERLLLLALGHHDDRHRLIDGADGLEDFQSTAARHLLVEQHDAIRLALQHDQGVVAMRRVVHREALLFEEQDVRGEAFDLIIDPQDALRTGHASNLTAARGAAQRAGGSRLRGLHSRRAPIPPRRPRRESSWCASAPSATSS